MAEEPHLIVPRVEVRTVSILLMKGVVIVLDLMVGMASFNDWLTTTAQDAFAFRSAVRLFAATFSPCVFCDVGFSSLVKSLHLEK